MTVRASKVDTYIDHEGPVAERYQWWGVYLIREKRRLQGIAEAVASGTPLVGGTPPAGGAGLDDTRLIPAVRPEPVAPEGGETPEEMLTRVDAELGMAEALANLEALESEESKTHGDAVRNEETISDELTTRKLSGRAALLGHASRRSIRKKSQDGEDF